MFSKHKFVLYMPIVCLRIDLNGRNVLAFGCISQQNDIVITNVTYVDSCYTEKYTNSSYTSIMFCSVIVDIEHIVLQSGVVRTEQCLNYTSIMQICSCI